MRRPRTVCLTLVAALVLAPFSQTGAQAQPKSPKGAAFLSLFVPGLGELYAGGHKSSRFFLFTEASFWTLLFTLKHLESSREDNFRSFAAQHAGLETAGKSDTFIDDVATFNSIYARNTRERFVSGEFAEPIPETPENVWEWNSDASRRQFRDLRSASISARQKSLLFVGALLFNRFASAINAAHIAGKTLPRPVQVGFVPHVSGGARALVTASF